MSRIGWAAAPGARPWVPPGTSGRASLLVEGRDRPPPGAMLIGEGEPGAGGLDLEHGPRPGDDRIRGGLFANRGEAGDREALVSPGDLSWAAVQPAGPDMDLDRLDSDHCHSRLLCAGSLGTHSSSWAQRRLERLFCSDGDPASNTCSMSSPRRPHDPAWP